MQRTSVMFVVLQLDAGGSERVVLDLATGLDPEQFDVYVAAFNGGALESILRKRCNRLFLIQKKMGFDFFAMVQIARIIKKYQIDIVNAHHYMPCFYSFLGTKILNNKKLIYTEHSVPEVEGIARSIHGRIFNRMLSRINAAVGVSCEITETFKELYPRHTKKFHTIINGVYIEKFRTMGDREDVRKRWGLSEEHFVVGTVANFRKVKNHACLIRAAARLRDSHPSLRFVFVGTGFPGDPENSEQDVRDLIVRLGLEQRIIITGYQENIPEMLSTFDVFCLPSTSEGMPISLLETMAARVPVIGSRVRGIREVINDRNTGLLFESDNDVDLARVLEEILSSQILANELATRAFSYVQRKHNKDVWIEKFARFLIN